MNPFEKKKANRDERKEAKQVINKWDSEAKKGKKSGLKACPGYVDHSGKKRVELTIPCPTCKRHFCSQECLDSHTEICKAKYIFNEQKDSKPLIELCHRIFLHYFDEKGNPLPYWIKFHDIHNNGGWYSMHMLTWKHPELSEAIRIMKKYDAEWIKNHTRKEDNHWWF